MQIGRHTLYLQVKMMEFDPLSLVNLVGHQDLSNLLMEAFTVVMQVQGLCIRSTQVREILPAGQGRLK